MKILEHWNDIVVVLSSLHIIALTIVNLTPTPKDDEAYSKVYKAVEKIAGVITKRAKL